MLALKEFCQMRYKMCYIYYIVYKILSYTMVLIPHNGHIMRFGDMDPISFFAILIFSLNITSSEASLTSNLKSYPIRCLVTLYSFSE